MKCPSCGYDGNERVCSRCGSTLNIPEPVRAEQPVGPDQYQSHTVTTIVVSSNVEEQPSSAKTGAKMGCLGWLLLVFGILLIIGLILNASESDNAYQPSNSISESKPAVESTKAEPVKPDLEALGLEWKREDYLLYAAGEVRNNTGKTYRNIQVSITVYDKSEAEIGSTMANVKRLDPGATMKFKALITQGNAFTFKVKGITGF